MNDPLGAEGATRAEVAYRHIKVLVLSAQLLPDAVVDEKLIARELDMSRTPVRQAIGRLAQEGLVRVLPQRGTLVAPLSVTDIEQVYLMRSLVEPAAGALAAQRAERADIERLERLEQEYVTALTERGDHFPHTTFHVAVAEVAGIPRLSKLVRELQEQTQWFLAVRYQQGRQVPSPHSHRELIAAIAAGDVERAREISRSSILASRAKILAGTVSDAELLLSGAAVLPSDISGI